MYVKVNLPLPIFESFTYKVPQNLKGDIKKRTRVSLTFRGKKFYGFVTEIISQKNFELECEPKEITGIIDNQPIVKPHLYELAKYISEYYLVSFGTALEIVVPRWVRLSKDEEYKANEEELVIREPAYELTQMQRSVVRILLDRYAKEDSLRKFLIWGITGSGKTEIYLQVIKELLKLGKSSIYIVPEIALTPQIVERVTERFGTSVVIMHSKLTEKQRRQNWQKLFYGNVKIVVGARSAVFAPLDNLGAIIIDEEHENTYKSEQSPRFNVKDIAMKLSEITGAFLILGSATPSLESYYKAKNGEITLIYIPERINKRPLPKIEIVNISKEKTNIFGISENLISTIRKAILNNDQVLLFINKRGYATFVRCAKCFYVLKCPKCSVAISYHKKESKLLCHHCNFEIEPFTNCPSCGFGALKMLGFGSQRIEEFVNKMFGISLIRMDSDQHWNYQEYKNAFELLKQKEVKVLVGTQMVAKGFDFPDVTVVGILGIDVLLSLKDFRTAERVFQLVIQVAGRCGRKEKEGYVFVETLNPDNYALTFAKNYDFDDFYTTELELRQKLSLPPYVFLTTITVEGKIYENVVKKINSIKEALEKLKKEKSIDCEILGPGQPQYKKLKNMHRFYLMLKTNSHADAKTLLHSLTPKFSYSSTLRVIIDFDPVDVL